MAIESTSAGIFTRLFSLYMGIALVIGGLVLGWLGYILVKYRARPDTKRPRDAPRAGVLPAERGHPIWSYVMAILIAVIMFGLAFGTISATHELETPPEGRDHLNVEVVGFQFGWRMVYTGNGGVVIPKINEFTIPVDTPVVANITSQDVWHNFALPEFRVRIDVIPGQTNHLWWEAHETGTVEPVCVQLCGASHALMRAKMHVVPQADFDAYLAAESAKEYAKIEKAGNLANVTYDGATLVADKTLDVTKAFAVRITNEAPTAERFTFGASTITVAPGESGLLSGAHAGTMLEALSTDVSLEFEEVS